MDTGSSIETSLESYRKDCDDLFEESLRINQQIVDAYSNLIPNIPLPATLDSVRSAADSLLDEDQENRFCEHWEPARATMHAKFDQLKKLLLELQIKLRDPDLYNPGRGNSANILFDKVLFGTDRWADRLSEEYRVLNRQLTVFELADKLKDPALKQAYLEGLPFARHMDIVSRPKPEPTVSEKRAYSASYLPPEIVGMIYSECDLESSVNLRRVNSLYYAVFKELEDVFEAKLHARNPWFKPEGDLKTYGDCVLVFVSRLSTWTCTDKSGELSISREDPKTKYLVASSLKHGEKPPAGFETITQHLPTCNCLRSREQNCGKIHMENERFRRAVLDPCTLEVELRPEEPPYSVERTSEGTVVKAEGLEITLPGHIREVDLEHWLSCNSPVTVGNHYVAVRTFVEGDHFGKNYLFYRHKPLHHRHALIFESYGPGKELGHLYSYASGSRSLQCYYDTSRDSLVEIDLQLRTSFCYNGLMWGNLMTSNGRNTAPTVAMFVDFLTPDKVYCNRDRTLPVYRTDWLDQSSKPGYTHFATSIGSAALTVVNLKDGTSICVLKPDCPVNQGEEGKSLVPGFKDDKFQVWYVSQDAMKRYKEKVWKMQESGPITGEE